jgi:hypothetical protein
MPPRNQVKFRLLAAPGQYGGLSLKVSPIPYFQALEIQVHCQGPWIPGPLVMAMVVWPQPEFNNHLGLRNPPDDKVQGPIRLLQASRVRWGADRSR